jgi:hypothetical protein
MKYLPWTILALVVAGVAYWYTQEKKREAAAAQTTSGASALCQGAAAIATKGLSMTSSVTGNLCNQLAPIITPIINTTKQAATDVKNEIKKATAGVQTWEYAVLPVAATHVAINEIENGYSKVASWF